MKKEEINVRREDIRKAFIASVPVMAGYIVLGAGFGIVLETKGLGLIWAVAMSVFIYAGSMQYVAIELITGGASLITTALTTLMVNARHLFYGISMVDKYKGAGKKKPYLIFALTDETYSLVCSDESVKDVNNKYLYYFTVSLLNQIYWITGTVIGSLSGRMINFSTEGIDFALTALFVTIFTEQWISEKNHGPAIAGLASSILCLVVFGKDNFLIPAMCCIVAVLGFMRKMQGKAECDGKELQDE
ncbi:MAG: AzlC family ABC transporter permease [Candidatus Fimisoma sp.]|nr:AzlC family ABC transporter permease [Bacillota bacterium]MDD7285918.1 AzlC family ABC transporter permease [Bacillota bacterium]MDY4747557.1 AzlC family ABC transporter permease [Candidatus Fimisoma sp.]